MIDQRSMVADQKWNFVAKNTAWACGVVFLCLFTVGLAGCAGRQYGHLLAQDDKDLVGSHAAGAATWNPLVEQAVAKLLTRCPPVANHAALPVDPLTGQTIAMPASTGHPAMGHDGPNPMGPATVCFVGIENHSAEDLLDFREQLYESIDSHINSNPAFRAVSRRMVDAALLEARLRPDALFLPANRDAFAAILGKQGTPVDFLMFAKITSGTTDRNKSSQRDYVLGLEIVNVHSGEYIKESAKIRKGYSKNRMGKWWNYGLFDQADG